MAEANISIAQDEFNCPICLDLLKEPVTTPCGHSYCMVCINEFWNRNRPMVPYECPQCRKTFSPRPDVSKNTILAEIMEKLKKAKPKPAAPLVGGDGDVECDSCSEVKHRALMSCLVCLASFCEAHLQPHYESPVFKKHTLVEASSCLQEQICSEHGKLLEVYCINDQQCICMMCTMEDHKGHETISAAAERAEKQKQLGEIQKKCSQEIQHRETNLNHLRINQIAHKRSAQSAVDHVKTICTELISCIQRKCSAVTELIRDQENAALNRATEISEKLKEEITNLRTKDTELQKLSRMKNHIHFLQRFQSLSGSAGSTEFCCNVSPVQCYTDAVNPVVQLREKLQDLCDEEGPISSGGFWNCDTCHMKNKPLEKKCMCCQTLRHIRDSSHTVNPKRLKTPGSGSTVVLQDCTGDEDHGTKPVVSNIPRVSFSGPGTREDLLHYSCVLTLDPNTAYKYLRLSENNTMVTYSNKVQQVLDHPDRFDHIVQLLCREGVCGRSYWEVEWTGIKGVSVALSYKSISRKGDGNECKFGRNHHSWRLFCSPSIFIFRHNNVDTKLPTIPGGCRIGVYVDYRAGTVSFYSVSDELRLLHRVLTSFTEPLYPGFVIGFESTLKLCH